jgi:hypothetical protein
MKDNRRTKHLKGPEGQQGDVEIFLIPDAIEIRTVHEIKPRSNRLIIAEGELTGRHHSIWMRATMFREDGSGSGPSRTDTDAMLKSVTTKRVGIARLYRDQAAVESMVKAGLLLRSDLAIGFLIVEDGPVTIRHQEHDGIRLEPGRYYVGGQVESAGADERMVAD